MSYRIIRQHDEKDCGAACLATVASFYGYRSDFSEFIRLTDTDKDGTNMNSITEAARRIGFEADGLSGSMEELIQGIAEKSIRCPFIAHIITEEETLHFIVVFEQKGDLFVIGDPGRGIYEIAITEFEKLWTGHMISLLPSEAFQKGKFGRSKAKALCKMIGSNKKTLIIVTLLSLLIVGIGIAGTFVFQATIDGFTASVGQT
ncbi:MAG: cysteine peptidase family C39 domain-containing protein, partial [Lachnospiraceae bacterium]